MIKVVTYAGDAPGTRLFVMGAIHGNEKCGTEAIHCLIREIDVGQLKIVRGKLTLLPIANPRAYELDKRFFERNLNRYFVPTDKPDCYEARLANVICPILEHCDALLSIHSYTSGGAPFAFAEPRDKREYAFADSLGTDALISGWAEAYAATGRKTMAAADAEEGTGTGEYARRQGAIAVDLECGQHKDPAAPGVAYDAIRNALRHFDMIDEPPTGAKASEARRITMTQVYYHDDAGHLAKPWKHLETVRKGEPLVIREDGTSLSAPADGYIILPKIGAQRGEEWFYFGK